MSTRSSVRNLFPPLDNPELIIRKRSRTDPTFLNDFEMAAEGTGDLPVPDLQTMEELCQPSLNGRGCLISPIAIQATNFRLKNDMIQQVQNSCQFHGLPGDDANKHLDKFLHVTQSIKVNGVTDDALCLYLFPHSLTHHATAWFDRLLRNSINTFKQTAKMLLGKYFPPSMVTKLRNEITNFRQRPDESLFEAWEHYKLSIDRCPNHNMLPVTQIDTFYNSLNLRHRDTINVAAGGTFMKRRPKECYDVIENMITHHNDWGTSAQQRASHGQNPPPAYQAPAYQAPAYQAPAYQASAYQAPGYQASVHQPQIPQQQVITTNEFTNFMKANDAILKNMKTNMTSLTNSKKFALKTCLEDLKGITTPSGTAYQGPTIPTTSSSLPTVVERETEGTKDMVHPTNNESTKNVQPLVVQIESPILNSKPVVAPIIEPVASLGDLDKFLIPCDFPRMAECLALADLDASINLMPLSVWNKLSHPNLSPTCMTLELADHSISYPVRVAEDVFVKVGTFHFSTDFVVIDFDADPRVPLILRRSFLKTRRDLIDVFEGELTLRVGKEAITFNLDQISRYSANYNDMTTTRIDVIDRDCEEHSQEVLGFSDVIANGNPTPYYDPIVSTTSPTLTPFENCDFLLEEVDAFLALEDDPTSPEVDQSYVDTDGDILFLEAFLNDDPSLPPPNQGNYLSQVRKELKICNDKLPVIITKDLSVEEKAALITVLKSHKRAISWKLSNIKGIDPEFCTHKILMEEDFEPAGDGWCVPNISSHGVDPSTHVTIRGIEEGGCGTSLELSVSRFISLSVGPELLCSEAIAVSSSKSTCIVSVIHLCDKRRRHNQELVLEAIDKRQIRDDFLISPMDNEYKLVS
nr:reverse transcriptase domain-containing protein [Tanacetum cinerariifolium]